MKRTLITTGLLAGLVLLLTSVLAACGGGPPDAVKIYAQVGEKMAGLSSYHMTVEAERDDGSPITFIEIDLVPPDRYRGLFWEAFEFMGVGDQFFARDADQSPDWFIYDEEVVGDSPIDMASFATHITTQIEGLTYLGEEVVNGTSTYHLRGSLPFEVLVLVDEENAPAEGITMDLWVGTKDSLVRRYRWIDYDAEEKDGIITLNLSRFNDGAISIVAPPDVRPAEDWARVEEQASAEANNATATGSPGLVDVEGRQLYLTCQGEGSLTVVLEAGGEGNSASWSPVQPRISEFTRVCAYDSTGEGFSSSFPAHESMDAMVKDLRSLLDAGGVSGPYVVVGHSFGGRLMPLFAHQYPADVVGMVLVDPGHEGFLSRAPNAVTSEEWQLYMELYGERMASMQETVTAADMGPSGDIPLVVLSASEPIDREGLSQEANEKFHDVLVGLHKELAANWPNGTHILVQNSGHAIQNDQPDLVIDAIRGVVDQIRNS